MTAVSIDASGATAPWNRLDRGDADPTKIVVKDFMFMPDAVDGQSGHHGDLDQYG